MEVEIDPLSMLEQSMQVNEGYSVSSNVDGDVMMLDDDLVEVQGPTIALNQVYFQPNEVLQQPESSLQDATFGFGEHFLISQNPDYGPRTSSIPAQQEISSPSLWKVNGRGRGTRGARARRGTVAGRGRARGSRSTAVTPLPKVLPSALRTQVQAIKPPTIENSSALIANKKLVSNVKRLSFASSEELGYRQKIFGDLGKVLNSRLDCTVCGEHIGCTAQMNVFMVTHPLLKVLSCFQCRENYCSTDWTLGPNNKDMRCRWCSKPSSHRSVLYNCTNCPFAFCEACIVRNYSKRDWNKMVQNDNWLCYVCQMVPLFFMRATCWALQMFVSSLGKRKNPGEHRKDLSKCCQGDVDTIDLVDETDTADSGNEPNGPQPPTSNSVSTISVFPISSRIDLLFSSVESIKQSVRKRLSVPVVPPDIDNLISDVNLSLAKIGRNLESCLDYIENWRTHTVEGLKKQEEVKQKRNQSVKRVNGSEDYSKLLQKFNIKPCKVRLEKLEIPEERTETSEPPSFFFSLIPQQLPSASKAHCSNNIKVLNCAIDDIICLDD